MNKLLSIFFISFLFYGCDHPEGRMYERDQGKQKEFKKRNNGEANINALETIVPNTNLNETRNVLPMEIENGVRYVWIEVNGIRLRFIFDTGASSICISTSEAIVLYRQGTLKREDIFSKEYFQDATGKISVGTKINLRTVKVGSMILENVKATVIDNFNAPLLLGQTVFEQFGKIEIDNDNSEIIFK